MSQLGKILLWVALAGAIVAGVFGGLLIFGKGGFNETKANLAQTTAAKIADDQTIVKDKAEYTALTAAKADSDAKLATANTTITDLNTQLDAAKKQAADSATALATANDSLKTAQDTLKQIKDALGDETPEQYKADKAKAASDLAAAQSEQKILQDSLQTSQAKVADLMDAINRSNMHPAKMPGVSGKVTFVDRTWNFVVLDVGLDAGVVPNGELIVYRGQSFLGKIRVTKVDPNDAVAEIMPDVKGDIQVGDKVLN
jgi:hypothetical protein